MRETNIVSLADRFGSTEQGQPITGNKMPSPPEWLEPRARELWPELAGSLHNHGIINELDQQILAIYISTYSRFVAADEGLGADDMIQKTPNNYEQLSARYVLWRDLAAQCLKFAKQLGLTPPARLALKAGDPNQGSLDF